MLNQFSRTEILIGKEGIKKLQASHVAVYGIGGVGSFVCEGLVRSGIGGLTLIDDDRICLTNLNRQLHAVRKTVGQFKVDAMKNRLLEINPDLAVTIIKKAYMPGDEEAFAGDCDYIVDAIDMVSSKIALIVEAKKKNIPIISCMGAGNKLDPTKFEVADIYETSVCPLAKVMRHELRARGVKSLKVVYSREVPLKPLDVAEASCRYHCICPEGTRRKCTERRAIPGSISFVPSVAGLILAGEVVKDLIGYKPDKAVNSQ